MLCAPPVLALLRQEFVNCWVLAKDLDAIAARDGSPEVATLCARIREHYKYPVDSVLLAPDLRVLGHVNAHDVAATARYVDFLRKGLEVAGRPVAAAAVEAGAAKRGPPSPQLVVTPEKPEASLLDVVRCRGFGQTSLVYYTIDATAFADGGVLEIEVRVGRAATGVTFELCAAAELPGDQAKDKSQVFMQPVQTRSVASEGTDKLVHTFKKGDPLGLVVTPAIGSSDGDTNAFFATAKVRRP